jgi:hypothetical protein
MTAIGFCTRYYSHEATYAALILANWAAAQHHDVSFFSATRKFAGIDSRWDPVVRASRGKPFTTWADAQDVVVWTHCPHIEQLEWCRNEGKHTVLFSLWHEFEPWQRDTFRAADVVLSPSEIAAHMLQSRWQVGRSIPLWLDPGLPLFNKHEERTAPKLLLPLWDGAARRIEMTMLELLDRMLELHDVGLTVTYSSSTLAGHAYERIKTLRRKYGPRVQSLAGTPWRDRPLVYQTHDLTLWPAHAESTCLTPLISLAMGTPLICFAVPPMHEILNQGNSYLVPCGVDYTPAGAAVCHPDYSRFEETLHEGLKNETGLRMLQQCTGDGFAVRRGLFSEILTRVFC